MAASDLGLRGDAREDSHGRNATTRLHEGRGTGCARLYGRRRRGSAHAGRSARARAAAAHAQARGRRDHRGDRRDARPRCAQGRHRVLHRPPDLDPGRRGAARSAHPQRASALCQFLSRGGRRDRPRQPGARRQAVRRARRGGATRVRRPDAPEQDRGLAGAARRLCLLRAAQRRRRRGVRHHGGLRGARHSLQGAHRADQEVVTMATHEKGDVAIVGAGASGSVFAAVLAKAGKKVVVLESGPDWQLSDLISSDFWGRRIKPAGGPFALEGKNPFGYVYQAGWGVGGAALHYFANFPRLLPNDFKIKSEHNRAHDWPISYSDVAPYYDKVARDIGVSGDAKAEEVWRPAGAPYPMPPMKTYRHGDVWVKACESVGIRLRPACINDGWCHVGCPTGALANPIVTYLGDARDAGAEVRARSTVTRVLTNQAGTKVTGVEYYDDKERQVQEASVVVLAAWSAQNPRLLLNSTSDKHPKGLANSNGLVGKYMMAHFASGTWA